MSTCRAWEQGGTTWCRTRGSRARGSRSEATDTDPEGAVQQGVSDYPLDDPRLAEAPDNGNGTVEVLAGADRSAPQ